MPRPVWIAVLVFAGGACGTVARAGLVEVADRGGWSVWMAILAVNTIGSLVLGWFIATPRTVAVRSFVAVGALGSFTTFSGVTVEFVEGVRGGDAIESTVLLCASVVVGVLAAIGGRRLAR
jgi:CrcB protein